jgi:hypothetical protein
MIQDCTAPAHRWACESPSGATVLGRCRNCGSERTFRADIDSFDYRSIPRFVRERASTRVLKGISWCGYSDSIAR